MSWELKKEHVCSNDACVVNKFDLVAEHQAVKHSIAAEIMPSRILEIGTRAGYSALAFLEASPKAYYLGIDAENGTHGGVGGPWLWWARRILSRFNTRLIQADSQLMNELPESGFWDLIHIDGDHTRKGARHDMELCWPAVTPGGLMLVDDMIFLQPVKQAVLDFAAAHPEANLEERDSFRGEALLWKPKQSSNP